MGMGSKAFESPLISHARMRAMYRALVELRVIAEQRKNRGFRGVEACWVGSAIDLQDGDLTSDSGGNDEMVMLDHIRAVGRRSAGGAIKGAEVRRIMKQLSGAKSEGFPGNAADRVLCAVGAAMALKAAANGKVSMAYVQRDALSSSEWKRVLAAMSQEGLPLVVLTLPGRKDEGDLEAIAHKAAVRPESATPVIPVDAGEVVAMYRVTQETTLRARVGGGAALIEGVACGTDAVGLIGSQLVWKGICTENWVKGVETQLKRLTAAR